jgi:uncharacterized phage protein (TIGR02218 family)
MTVRTWAQCLRIERTDGETIALTELDKDVVYDGVTYKANVSYTPAVIDGTANLAVNNTETQGYLHLTGIPKSDIVAGLFDHARVYFLIVDYVALTKVKDLGTGWLGETTLTDNGYSIEYRSLTQSLQQTIGRTFQKDCDARLGDTRCGVTLATYTETGTLTGVTSNSVVTDSGRAEAANYFSYGNMTMTSGVNNGISREVRVFSSGEFTLFMPFPYDVEVGDTYSVYAGCNKQLATCRDKFDNVGNFQGFPDKPQRDEAAKFGGQ